MALLGTIIVFLTLVNALRRTSSTNVEEQLVGSASVLTADGGLVLGGEYPFTGKLHMLQ